MRERARPVSPSAGDPLADPRGVRGRHRWRESPWRHHRSHTRGGRRRAASRSRTTRDVTAGDVSAGGFRPSDVGLRRSEWLSTNPELGGHQPASAVDRRLTVVTDAVDTDSVCRSLSFADRPHLVVSARELIGRIGPLVEPGQTPCHFCLALARRDRDPAWAEHLAAATDHGYPGRRCAVGWNDRLRRRRSCRRLAHRWTPAFGRWLRRHPLSASGSNSSTDLPTPRMWVRMARVVDVTRQWQGDRPPSARGHSHRAPCRPPTWASPGVPRWASGSG